MILRHFAPLTWGPRRGKLIDFGWHAWGGTSLSPSEGRGCRGNHVLRYAKGRATPTRGIWDVVNRPTSWSAWCRIIESGSTPGSCRLWAVRPTSATCSPNVNVVIWQKAANYVEGTDFWRWASQIAYFEVLTYRKRRGRDRLVFDDDLLASVAVEADRQMAWIDADLVASAPLRREAALPGPGPASQKGVSLGSSVKRLAELLGESPPAWPRPSIASA